MNNFLRENYYLITHTVEFLAVFSGIFYFKKFKNSNTKYFIYFLAYIFICEILARYVHFIKDGFLNFLHDSKFSYNYWWSTLFWGIGAIAFYAFYFEKILSRKDFKKIIKWSRFLFVIFSILYILINWERYFTGYFPIISILGALIILLGCVFYFIEILQSDKILSFYKSINFYITSTIFIWWLIITPLVFFDIYNFNLDQNFIFLKWQIYLFLNVFMYATFTFALIFCKPNKEIEDVK